jgi:soluble lytic murein transglycosylase-like protein
MSHVIDSRRTQRRAILALSLLIGVSLALRTSQLQSGFILHSHAGPARSLGLMCKISAEITPDIKALSRDIARRFHLARGAAVSITRAAFTAAQARGIDPTLVLAVAAVESKFKPGAINPATGAAGLMQIMPKWHRDQILGVGGEPSLLLIAPNLAVGATILAEYLDAEDGDVNDALGHYLGTSGADRYVKRVNLEMAHFTRVMKAG